MGKLLSAPTNLEASITTIGRSHLFNAAARKSVSATLAHRS